MKFGKYEITELENGLRIISEYIPHFRSISLGLWIATGSRNENEENNGITHLIEHLLFKGTKNKTYTDIAVAFDSMGAEYNAFTDKENTCVYADFIDTHLDRCASLLFDIVFNPSFLPENIEMEKKIINEEIQMVEDNPSENIFNYFYREIFYNHPLRLPVLGNKHSLKKINPAIIWDYFKENFNLKNIVISAAGNTRHGNLVEVVKKNLENFKNISGGQRNNISKKKSVNRKVKKSFSTNTKAAHLCYGSVGCSRIDEKKYPLAIFTNIFGGSMSSRLFQKIREEKGLSYSLYSINTYYADTGTVATYAATSYENLNQVIELIEKEIKDIQEKGLKESEIRRAKENIKGNIVLGVEDISSRMFRLGKSLLMDKKVLTINEILKKIDSIKGRKIDEMAHKYFEPENMSLIILAGKK
ncbi:MAG: pitrilysin family protein [Candidatus Humimicrobiaceae bacterium]